MFDDGPGATIFERPTGVVCYQAEFLRLHYNHAGEPDPDRRVSLSFLERLKDIFPSPLAIFRPAEFERRREALHVAMAMAAKEAVDRSQIDAIPGSLASTGLVWWWQSAPDCPPDMPAREWQTGVFAPPRNWTLLTDENCQSLADDIAEYDFRDSTGRSITLLGFDASVAPATIEPNWLKDQLREFCFNETGPINIVIWNFCDQPWDYFFVPHHPSTAVQKILSSLGLDGSRSLHRRKYSWLWGARLERIHDLQP